MRRILPGLILIAILTVPTAAASVELDLGIVALSAQDGRCEACIADVTGADDPGNATIDTTQRVQSMDVSTRAPLVPAFERDLNGSEVYVQYSFIRQVRETYDTIPQDRPYRDSAGLVFNETGYGFYYYGPSPAPPVGSSRNQSIGFEWGDGESGPGYEQMGPFNTPCCGNTDNFTHTDGFACWYTDEMICETYHTEVAERVRGSTPWIGYGLTMYDVRASQSPP